MSQEEVEIVKGLFSALDSEPEAALEVFDAEVEWSPTEGGTFHGPEGVMRSLAAWIEPWQEHHIDAEEFSELGDQVLAVIHIRGRGVGSGLEVDQRFFQVYTLRNAKIVRMTEFVTRAEALGAAGLCD